MSNRQANLSIALPRNRMRPAPVRTLPVDNVDDYYLEGSSADQSRSPSISPRGRGMDDYDLDDYTTRRSPSPRSLSPTSNRSRPVYRGAVADDSRSPSPYPRSRSPTPPARVMPGDGPVARRMPYIGRQALRRYRSPSPRSPLPVRPPRPVTAAEITAAEMERNVTNLPAFPDLEYGQEVSLPEELLNEPYSFYDNGLRPEITVRRAPFSYSIDEYGTPSLLAIDMRIAKNNQAMAARPRSRGMRIHDVPEKRTSNYSVLNVYDTYGYDVARSFLKHIYYHKFNSDNQQWLSVYLEGSLKANGLDYFNPVEEEKGISYVFYLCYEIQRKLREIDQSQPKMKGQLQDIGTYLPADILNRIIPSERVSKSIASQVRYEKCDYTPTNEELDSYHDYNNEGISLLEESIYASFSSGHDKHLSIEQVEDDLFEVRDDYDDLRYSMTYKSVLYTLETYEAYYRSQGCNVSSSMQGMLKKLLARLDTNHEAYLDEILPWFLLLARDSDDILGEYTLEDIWTELRRLVNATIDRYN